MKIVPVRITRSIPFALAACCFCLCLLASQTKAGTLYFDSNGTTAGYGTGGAWDGANWASTTGGTSSTGTWTAGDFAEFQTAASSIVTVSASESMAGMYNTVSGATLTINQASSSGNLSVTATGGTAITGIGSVQGFLTYGPIVINCPIVGTGGIEPEYEGTGGAIYLNTNNTYSGGTYEQSSSTLINFDNNNSFGTGGIALGFAAGSFAPLLAYGGQTITLPNYWTNNGTGGGVNFAGSASTPVVCNGTWSLGATSLQIRNNGSSTSPLTLNGIISSGTGGQVMFAGGGNGAATTTITGVNTYAGSTTITNTSTGGITLVIGGAGQLGSGSYAGAITNSGKALVYNSSANQTLSGVISGIGALVQSGPGNLTLKGVNTYTGGTLITNGSTLTIGGSGSLATTGTITNGSTSTLFFNSTAAQTLSGVISGAGTFILSNNPNVTLTLSGANTFTGLTVISNGVLQIGADGYLGTAPSSAVTNQITLNCGTSTNAGLRASASFTLNANRGITLGANGGAIQVAGNDTFTYGGIINGPGNFECGTTTTTGYGNILLNNTNNYQGSTTIAAGVIELGIDGALPYGTPLTIAAADSVGGTLNLEGHSQTIGPLASSPGIDGTGTDVPSIVLSGALTVIENSDTAFNGAITGSGGSLTINGTGTLTLNASNSYSGPTTISAGTLALGIGGAISNTPSISVAAGATFDVSSVAAYALTSSNTLSGFGTVNGTIALATGSAIAPGNSTTIGTLTNTGSILLQSGGTNIVKVQDALAGPGAGNDLLAVSGNLAVQSTAGSPFTIKLVSIDGTGAPNPAANFVNTTNYTWTIATGTISNYNGQAFYVDTSSFANPLGGGQFFVSNSGSTLTLVFHPAPGSLSGEGGSITSPSVNSSGNPTLSGNGIPGYVYGVESETNLFGPWAEAGSTTVDSTGAWTFTDASQTNPPTIFYRTYYPDDPSSPPQ